MKKNHFIRLLLTAALFASLFAPGLHAQILTKKTVSLELARKLVAAAQIEAAKNKWTMAITIVDDGGNLVCFERMDGTQLGSIEVAQHKARTALLFKRPTKVFEDMVLIDKRVAALSIPNVIAIEGGLPLVVDGVPIGAIGVSGAKSSEDGIVAKAALDAVPLQ
jgi:glc operon protein GlcG